MNSHDNTYLNLARSVLDANNQKSNRTNTGTLATFGERMVFDVSDGTVPILTTKKMNPTTMIHELVWYFSGDTNIKYLQDNGVVIWNNWADDNGDLGPLYGRQLRNFNGCDQLQMVLNSLSTDPDSRRMVVSYWDPNLLPIDLAFPENNPKLGRQALAPCHLLWQVATRVIPEDELGRTRQLDLQLYQRSADIFLGVPFNIAQYSMILHLLCHQTNMAPGKFIWVGGDVHVYANHIEQVKLQLTRDPRPSPTIEINPQLTDITKLTVNDIKIRGYDNPHPFISAPVAV